MKKPATASGVLLAALAASALLQGCRTQQPGTPSRRTVFGGPTITDDEVPAAVVRDASASRARPSRPVATGAGEIIVPGPTIDTAPAPAPVAPASRPAPSAGADSYRRYMGGDAASAPAPAPHPVPPTGPAAHPAPMQTTGSWGPAPTPAPAPAPAATPAPAPEAYRIHVVEPGESAGKIANANGMRLSEFVQLNGLSDPNRLEVGQRVRVATGRTALAGSSSADPTEGGRYYVVRAGDTLGAIAGRHNTSVAELQRLNGISNPNAIREGQRLLVPGAGGAPHPTTPTVHPPVTPRPPVTPTVPTTTRPVAPPPTTRPVAPPPTTTRPVVAPPPPPTTHSAGTEPGVVEIGGTAVNSRELLAPGGSLLDVVTPTATEPASTPEQPSAPVATAPGTREYVVKDGEDIYSIGLDLGVKPFRIRELNHGRNLEGLKAGDRILVPAQ